MSNMYPAGGSIGDSSVALSLDEGPDEYGHGVQSSVGRLRARMCEPRLEMWIQGRMRNLEFSRSTAVSSRAVAVSIR